MFSTFHRHLAAVLITLLSSIASADEIRVEANKAAGTHNLQTITLEGDTLFKLNQATLSDKGRAALDNLISSNVLFPLDQYRIVGHSDRVGNPVKNQKLSLRRAQAVEKYLRQQNANLKLESMGAGAQHPKVNCGNNLSNKKLVECLAPNRRVEIERINAQ